MNFNAWLRHGVRIARIERTRSRRQLNRSSVLRALIAVLLVSTVIGSGLGAYTFGAALRRGQVTLPINSIQAATTAGFLMLLIPLIQRTSRLTERLDTDHLLTTVPAREVVLGVVLAASSRIIVRISLTAVSVAIGFAVGAQSSAIALSIVVAVAGLLALVTLLGVALSFVIELVTTRSPRFRRYKNALVVVGFGFVTVVWAVANAGLVSVSRVIGRLAAAPPAWFVDLGLVGVPAAQSSLLRSVGALGVVVVGIPVLMVATIGLAERVWETEPVSAAVLHRSRSLVGAGLAERLFISHVSRPVLTVARKRWLQERRVPRALLMGGYTLLLLALVWFPMLATGEILLVSPVLLAYVLAVGTGLAFGMSPIAAEYASLPMTLTTITGEQFVRGTVLSGVVIGTPFTALGTLLLAVVAPLGALEPLLLGLVGAVLSVCSITLAAAIGMGVSYRVLVPTPVPLVSTTIHTEIGRASFIRMGKILGLVGLICLPALGGYLPGVFEPVSTLLGIPAVAVRVGSLVVTVGLVVGVSVATYRRAVRLYDQYTLA